MGYRSPRVLPGGLPRLIIEIQFIFFSQFVEFNLDSMQYLKQPFKILSTARMEKK